jgi:signal transduction histidine kinase
LEAKQVEPKLEVFSVTELLHDVSMQTRPVAIAKEVHFNAELPQESLFVKSDIGLIQRVVQNLIDNAIHYTNPGGTVTVGLKIIAEERIDAAVRPQSIQIFVSDTGSGIPEDELAHIFDRYYRSDNVRAKHRAGLGLGLAISKHILHLCGSILKVKSKIGEGTTFYFELNSYRETYSELLH